MATVGCHGLPLTVTTHPANNHEVTLVQLTFDFYMIGGAPEEPDRRWCLRQRQA